MLDDVDLDIVAALHIAPRVPTATLASILDIPTSTANRRIARMQDERLLRVVGRFAWDLIVSSNPYELWITSSPGQSHAVTAALLGIPDVQAVIQTSGSTDIYANLYPLRGSDPQELLVERIPAIPGIRAIDSRMILETAKVGQAWRFPRLPQRQQLALEAEAAVEHQPPLASLAELTELEFQTMRLLGENGRITAAEVGRRLGVSASTASRAIRTLLQTGAVTCRVEIEPSLIGFPLMAFVSLDVRPRDISRALETLAAHPAIRLLCTVTGEAPVSLAASFSGPAALSEFLRQDLGALPGVTSLSSATALRTVRRYWVDRDGMRLGSATQDVLRR
nr:Lrp/AsnC family transcriptional regulator [Agrococcus sp. ARC_14]